jgi:hypothetical protein
VTGLPVRKEKGVVMRSAVWRHGGRDVRLLSVLLFVFAAVFAGSPARAQLEEWSDTFGSTLGDMARGVTVDGSGNVIVVGEFKDQIDFDGAPLVAVGNGPNAFVAKFSYVNGTWTCVWKKGIGDENAACDVTGTSAYGVSTDNGGGVYVTGRFCGGNVDFDGDGWETTDPSSEPNPGDDAFVVKYSASGGFQWVWTYAGEWGGNDAGLGICLDNREGGGYVYVTGRDFIPGVNQDQIFLARLFVESGAPAWVHVYGGEGNDKGTSVCVDGNGDVTLTGSFSDTVDFGNGTGSLSANGVDVFLAKFDDDPYGQAFWSDSFGTGYVCEGTGVCAATDRSIWLTGYFAGNNMSFGAGYLNWGGNSDVFLVKFNSSMQHLFSQGFGGSLMDEGKGVAVDDRGAVLLTGAFQSSIDFGGRSLTSAGQSDVFLAMFDAGGNHEWSRGFGASGNDIGYGVAAPSVGDVMFAGGFQGSVDFGGGPQQSHGDSDVFLSGYTTYYRIMDVEANTTEFDPVNYLWTETISCAIIDDATTPPTAIAPGSVTVYFNDLTDCNPGDCAGPWSPSVTVESPGPLPEIDLEGLIPSANWCFYMKAESVPDHGGWMEYYDGGFSLNNSYSWIYGIGHGFLSGACKIVVEWNTKYLSKNNRVLYRKTGTYNWSTVYAQEGVDCDLERNYVAMFDVQPSTSYQFKIWSQIDGITYSSGVMTRSSGSCAPKDPIPIDPSSGPEFDTPFIHAYPNPFNPSTTVSFNVPSHADVDLRIYSADGRYVTTLASGPYDQGVHNVNWDATNASGEKVSSGIYFVRLTVGQDVLTSKVVLLK